MVGQCEATSAAGLNLKHIGDFPQPDVSARGPFVAKKSITYASIREGSGLPAGPAGHRQGTFISGGLRGAFLSPH